MQHLIRYTVRPELIDENERLIDAVFAALAESRPANVRYAVFRQADSGAFVHLVASDGADGSKPLTSLPAFQAFAAGVGERAIDPPQRVELRSLGSYGRFDV